MKQKKAELDDNGTISVCVCCSIVEKPIKLIDVLCYCSPWSSLFPYFTYVHINACLYTVSFLETAKIVVATHFARSELILFARKEDVTL